MKRNRWLSLLLALALLLTATGLAELATPTDLTPVVTQAPTKAPTEAPTAAPTPTNKPTSVPNNPDWDETTCDHMNPNCVQAPACDRPNCEHIGRDKNGLDVPLCRLGRWLLDQQDKALRGELDNRLRVVSRSVRSQTIDLSLEDVTIYRSGVYKVKDTIPEEHPEEHVPHSLTITEDRLVILELNTVDSTGLYLSNRSSTALTLVGISQLDALSLSNDASLQINAGGHVTIDAVSMDPEKSKVTIRGGSVQASLQESERCTMHAFYAPEAVSVYVNGESYPASQPAENGYYYLWLSPVPEGCEYTADQAGSELYIVLTGDVPEGTVTPEPTVTPAPVDTDESDDEPTETVTPDPTETPVATESPVLTPVPGTVLLVLNAKDEPVANTAMTLQILQDTRQCATDENGNIFLTESYPDNTAAAAMDRRMVYTGIIQAGQAILDPTSKISQVKAEDQEDGTVKVTFTAENAASFGVQWSEERKLPDTYVEEAYRTAGTEGEVILTDVPAGTDMALRVYVARAAGAELTAASADGFRFSQQVNHHHKGLYVPEELEDVTYTGKPYTCPLTFPEGAQVTYEGKKLNENGQPVEVGTYNLVLTIPDTQPDWLPGTWKLPFQIKPITLTIIPDKNQEKYQDEEDPEFTYRVEGLLKGDEVKGHLTREEGEEPGNYAFKVDKLKAPDYYTLELKRRAAKFTILPLPDDDLWFPMGFWEHLYPIEQEITRNDGRVLRVVLNLQDSLVLTNSRFGSIVRSAVQYEPTAMFSPSLSWDRETDEVLLRLRTEPEMNKDKGYATDAEGHLVWSGHEIRMLYSNIRYMREMGIDAIALNNGGASIACRLEDLVSEEMQAQVKQAKGELSSAVFRLWIEPDADVPEDAMAGGWHVKLTLTPSYGQEPIDVCALCPSATVAADMEPVASFLKGVGLYEENSFPGQFTLTAGETALAGSTFVEPFMPGERLRGLMYTHRYLSAPLRGEQTVYVNVLEGNR